MGPRKRGPWGGRPTRSGAWLGDRTSVIFGFLWLVLSGTQGQESGKLSVSDQVLAAWADCSRG